MTSPGTDTSEHSTAAPRTSVCLITLKIHHKYSPSVGDRGVMSVLNGSKAAEVRVSQPKALRHTRRPVSVQRFSREGSMETTWARNTLRIFAVWTAIVLAVVSRAISRPTPRQDHANSPLTPTQLSPAHCNGLKPCNFVPKHHRSLPRFAEISTAASTRSSDPRRGGRGGPSIPSYQTWT